jgi:type VI secretion system secreted protein Hcp
MADVYAFLDLNGIKGESQDSDYSDKIELQSVSWGGANNSSFAVGTGSGIGKGQIQDIQCSKFTDISSPELMKRVVTGLTIDGDSTLTLLKLSGDTKIPYVTIKMTDTVVTNFHLGASADGQLPTESFSLHFKKVDFTYTTQSNDGTASGGKTFVWDLQQNTSGG